ncbi:MAG: hypothetical protein ACRD4R_08410 [Candidatus Acidiferrales bacterium]
MKNVARQAILVVSAAMLACAMGICAQAAGATKTLTGVVSDSMCGKTHGMKGMTDAQCTRMCVKGGASFALVVGDKVVDLRGDSAALSKYAARKVTVRGTMHGKDLVVESVMPAK